MYFDSVNAMLHMGGHGAFVWSAYLITTVVVALLLLAPRCRQRRFLRRLAAELKRQRGTPVAIEEDA